MGYMNHSLLLVSPLITPIVVPYIIPYIRPLRSLDYSSYRGFIKGHNKRRGTSGFRAQGFNPWVSSLGLRVEGDEAWALHLGLMVWIKV